MKWKKQKAGIDTLMWHLYSRGRVVTDLDQIPEAQHADEQGGEDEAACIAHLP